MRRLGLREYRGRRADNGRWICGLFCREKRDGLIVPCIEVEHESDFGDWIERVEIDGATLSQSTGLRDRNRTPIFEGDIVRSCEYGDVYAVRYFDDDNYPAFDLVPAIEYCECNGLAHLICVEGVEVVGNIYDHPNRLKGEGK